jgi:arsenite methyltransferase
MFVAGRETLVSEGDTMAETTGVDEMEAARSLPQLDSSGLVDAEELEGAVKEMYREVAEGAETALHFKTGRGLAERLGYDPAVLDRIPAEAIDSFAGVGFAHDLAATSEGDRVLDLGSGSGTDIFYAATLVGPSGRAVGVDFTPEQLAKARRLQAEGGFEQVELVEAEIEQLPFEDSTFDVVMSNGVINLSPHKDRVFAEAARVLRPGGRLAVSDIVSGKPLKERTRRNTELWAACIAGAIPRTAYVEGVEATGLRVGEVRDNDYEFISERALEACGTYEVVSVSLVAEKLG